MRSGAALSFSLHAGLIALLLVSLQEAGGSPTLGNGGQVAFEVVAGLPGGAPAEAASGEAETVEVVVAVPPAPAPE